MSEKFIEVIKDDIAAVMEEYKRKRAELEYKQPPLSASPCPSCGACPTCGRGGAYTYPHWPYRPSPWWEVTQPGIIYYGDTSNTFTVSK